MDLKNILEKQSIIQLTLFKIIFSIFTFLIISILLYGYNFWEKQDLKLNYDLVLSALNVQSEINSRILSIEEIKYDKDLTNQDKILKVKKIINSIIDKNDYIGGYYDSDLDLIVKSKYSHQKISDNDIHSGISSLNEFKNVPNNKVFLPVYSNQKIVGYVWAFSHKPDIIYVSYYQLSAIIILILTLSVLIIVSIRKHMNQIERYLEKFCNIIINDEKKYGNILNKLPELKPVLNKLTFFTDHLKEINIALESSKLNIIKIMKGISDGFYALDLEWKFTFVNHKIEIVTNNVDLIGKSIWEVFPQFKDSITYEKMSEAMSKNEPVHWEAEGLANSDQDHEFHAYPYNEGLTVFFRDITESKRQQQELDRLERLNLIGQLAAGISHEIRNPLTTVKGFLQIFAAKPQYLNDKEYMDLMISEIDRANVIITDFLSLAKANSDNIVCQNINEVISKVLPMIQADAYNNNKEVTVDLSQLPDIMINENEIKQLILNLVRNGLEATPEQGCVKISTYLNSDKVVLEIKDQGEGIPQEIQKKMGTPFFTTKESGTGLGLAISIGIAQRHGAGFEFKTGGSGTIFYISFPHS